MAEAKKKKSKPKSAKVRKQEFNQAMTDLASDNTFTWFLEVPYSADGCRVNTQYNQLADQVFAGMDLCFCMLQVQQGASNGTIRQFSSQQYTELVKFNPAWVGFYPSSYEWEVVIDEAGNTNKIPINDYQQLENVINLNRGEKFFFAGLQYKLVNKNKKKDSDLTMGWQIMAEDKTSKTGIYVRSITLGGWVTYMIFNYALDGHKTRKCHGSTGSVCMTLGKIVKNYFLNDEYGPFIEDPCDEDFDW